ncbi:hypothetical protein BFP97_19590 [Roseivirga sp. 4D4]|uniref:GDSL-type esterase/lipase family protein n=1 Tax=Roseivirga sp. 4D4 TaxID=1889784 RepID=UPI0008531431|nr:GDSL-type esterase/lipase family protein [Roseivirga sp. 4D4]OEK03584.1 hypothetical protein BFP97_19590 [Roseivirga sp. 4D4]
MSKFTISSLLILLSLTCLAQDPTRFAEEVDKIKVTETNYPSENRIVFTGSSSIRLWTDFKDYFSDHNVINTGFGGSETSDLIHYKKELVSNFKPEQVFIYEGDNDINSGKSSFEIFTDLTALVGDLIIKDGIKNIVIISPKPSIARWSLKAKYEELNQVLEKVCAIWDEIQFVDVWTPMLNTDGSLKKDLFIEDGLHMNKAGYDIWIAQIRPFLIKP